MTCGARTELFVTSLVDFSRLSVGFASVQRPVPVRFRP